MHQRFSVASPGGRDLPTDVVTYGPDVAARGHAPAAGRPSTGKRVLDLGCGAGHNAIALARQGAKVIGVDESSDQVAEARAACEREEVRVELHHAPLAELAFIRADTIDAVAVGVGAGARRRRRPRVPTGRPRAAPRAPAGALAAAPCLRADRHGRPRAAGAALVLGDPPSPTAIVPRTIGTLFTALGRANFRVDTVLEPQPHRRRPAHAPPGTTTCATSRARSSSGPASRASDERARRAGSRLSGADAIASARARAGLARRPVAWGWTATTADADCRPPPRGRVRRPQRGGRRAWAAEPLTTHRTKTPTIWWHYRLEEERTHTRMVTSTDANGHSSTRTETYEQWHEIDAQGGRAGRPSRWSTPRVRCPSASRARTSRARAARPGVPRRRTATRAC